jgi:hypothetical protein
MTNYLVVLGVLSAPLVFAACVVKLLPSPPAPRRNNTIGLIHLGIAGAGILICGAVTVWVANASSPPGDNRLAVNLGALAAINIIAITIISYARFIEGGAKTKRRIGFLRAFLGFGAIASMCGSEHGVGWLLFVTAANGCLGLAVWLVFFNRSGS